MPLIHPLTHTDWLPCKAPVSSGTLRHAQSGIELALIFIPVLLTKSMRVNISSLKKKRLTVNQKLSSKSDDKLAFCQPLPFKTLSSTVEIIAS